LKPHQKQYWCVATFNAEYIARMEDILLLYGRAPNPKRPRIAFDERPCILLGNRILPLPMKSGTPLREDYQYERHGIANVLLAYDLDTGQRFVHIRRRRRAEEYAIFFQQIAARYSDAEAIDVVQDNLNIHCAASFYTTFDAATALALAQRFSFHFTPKHASWLNIAELEFSAYARQCANQRWESLNAFVEGTVAYFQRRNAENIKVSWQFSPENARVKFQRQYQEIKTK
jgi:DDE superfamily endonuclease